jgi:exosome complex component RRP4
VIDDNMEKDSKDDGIEGRELREIVVPGDVLAADDALKSGVGTYKEKEKIYAAQLGVKSVRAGYVNVVPLSGKYMPRSGDSVIGTIIDIGATNWLVDINAPYPAPLHVNEVPWKVEFGDTSHYLRVGDAILVKVLNVDETKRIQVTMKEHGLRRLTGGQIVEVASSKVPRVIGRSGSMISLLKDYTGCRIFVGQNGRIWVDGEIEGIVSVILAIQKIEEEAQVMGLTDSIKEFLEGMSEKKS